MRKLLVIILALVLLCDSAHADSSPKRLDAYMTRPQVVGSGVLSFWFADVYSAKLFAPDGVWKLSEPFALALTYERSLGSREICERTMQEIRGLGFNNELRLGAWFSELRAIIPDVQKGSVITGIRTKEGFVDFYKGDDLVGSIRDSDFAYWFFSIWLNEKTSEPELRRSLLGVKE